MITSGKKILPLVI